MPVILKTTMATRRKLYQYLWLMIFMSVLAWSGVRPHDYFTWFLEVAPALIGLTIIVLTRKNFELTPLAYWLILVHAIVLMIGGHYTYAEVPLFNWLRDAWAMDRNNYDKVGHFAQGFIPAIVAREVLLRTSPLKSGKMLFFLIICICLAISALYELIEWWVAVATGTAAEAFLGTQGYAWDTQSDMAFALAGAIVSLLALSSIHDRQLILRGTPKP
jgi:putative membrane protein